jgi:preprotein translocase subunit YajC
MEKSYVNGFLVLAQTGGAPGAGGPGGQSPFFLPVVMFIAIGFMFFTQIRGQRKKDKERREMLASIKSGDRVLFSGGIIGVITNVKEKTYVVRIGDKNKIEVLRSAVTSVIQSDDLPTGTEAEMGGN